MSRLSVIIVNYNTCEMLRRCLSAVTRSTVIPKIWVVDNHSTDDSVSMVKREFPEVKTIVNDRNLGFARANNLAIGGGYEGSEYFLLLNSDAFLAPDAVEKLIVFLDERPQTAVVSGQLYDPDGTPQHTAVAEPSLMTELFPKFLLRWLFPQKFYAKDYFIGKNSTTVESLVGAAICLRKSMAAEENFFDERFFFFFEESDLLRRLRRRGYEITIFPQIKIIHEQGASAKKNVVCARIEYWRSRYLYFRKHYSPLSNALLIGGLLWKNLGNLILNGLLAFRKRNRDKAKLAATIFLWHLRGRPAAMGISTKP